MRLLEFFTHIDMSRIDELFIRYKPQQKSNDYRLINSRENIWLYTHADDDNEQLVRDIAYRTGLSGESVDELEDEGRERGDLITGQYNPSEHSMWYDGDPARMMHNPAVSLQFKKLAQYLDINYVNGQRMSGEEEVEVEHHQSEMQGDHADEMWHGTNTGAMSEILTVGLVPGRGTPNWENVGQFGDVVFLSEDFYNAKFHAERQAHNKGNVEPVVLKFKIPNKDLIVPDFDMASAMGNNPELEDELAYSGSRDWNAEHQVKRREEIKKYNPGTDMTKISGIVGYRGRIPANHITAIVANLSGEMGGGDDSDYHEFTLEEFRDALNTYHDYGYWYEGIEDEMAEMEEQEDDD